MLDFSVVINTKDRPQNVETCLSALTEQSLASERWEIVVIDDGSADDQTKQAVERFRGSMRCRYVRIPHGGRSVARNAGIDAAEGHFVLFLGDDVILQKDALKEHLLAHEKWPHSAVVGLYVWEGESPSSVFRERVETCYFSRIQSPESASWRYFYTGNASVERRCLVEVGGFDENFFRYGWEDMDLGVRLERAGVKIVYHAEAHATHRHPHISLQGLCRTEYEQAFSAWYFFSKWSEDADVQADRFWNQDPRAKQKGSQWRKTLGRGAIHAAESVVPIAPLLRVLYDRLLWSYRWDGLRAGQEYYEGLLQRWHQGSLTEAERSRRFQQ